MRVAAGACAAFWLVASPAAAYTFADGRIELHGFYQSTLRTLSDDYQTNDWYLSQWAQVLNLEADLDLAPEGFGPFDLVSGFARVEVRYECVYTGCAVFNSHRYFGDRATRAPARNWGDGVTSGLSGLVNVEPQERVQDGSPFLFTFPDSPLLAEIADFGGTNVDPTLAPVADDLFTTKKIFSTLSSTNTILGPWRPKSQVRANGTLRPVPSTTLPLPMRPAVPDTPTSFGAQGLFVPSLGLRQHENQFDNMDLDFRQSELEWNYGASQDEHELKELYLELEMLEGRLWWRVGKQNIVWGKTELFRTTDQFNPQDIALASLPSLEESRIALWSVRGIYSFYDVGPFEDVRLELAANYDEVEPTDLGRCGEPYTVWLVCLKGVGAFAHGLLGLGLAGEVRPPDPWDSLEGVELGARLEFRWSRFSFAISDFWGYSDTPTLDSIHFYERRVDAASGQPLDVFGNPLTPDTALELHPGNRQFFDFVCSITVGVATVISDALAERCILDVTNENTLNILTTIVTGAPQFVSDPLAEPTLAGLLSNLFAGNRGAQFAVIPLVGPDVEWAETNVDLCDGFLPDCVTPAPDADGDGQVDTNTFFGAFGLRPTLNQLLTPQQQALLGCGVFYNTNCESDGIDLFNSEASVLLQSFPQVEPIPPVATRVTAGGVVILPGARGPGDPGYDPRVDGCVDPFGHPDCAGTDPVVNPDTGELFPNEMAAVSFNFMKFLAALSLPDPDCTPDPTDPDCDPDQGDPACDLSNPISCPAQRVALVVAGTQRPELRAAGNGRFGRRDWFWLGGGEAVLRYHKRNVLGFSMDFAEDLTKTNWGVEFTWIDDAAFSSNTSRSLNQAADAFNLTLSMDRPTFVNFMNQNRTLFLNSQWFFGYVKGYNQSFPGNGPLSVLATFTVATGYFQDRLLPAITLVHDFRSASGGAIAQVGYRYTENFSVGFGSAIFYGGPENAPVSLHQLALGNNGGNFEARSAYNGLSAISERDELFVTVRYTF